MTENVTLVVNKETFEKIHNHYKDFLVDNNGQYVAFQAKVNGLVVTGWLSKSEKSKITFSGEDALGTAKVWENEATIKENKKSVQKSDWICLDDQIGSDEVGVGDFLAPMIVVAALVTKEDINDLKKLGIDDSKKLTDEKIREIASIAIKKFKFSKNTIPNSKYNELIAKGENLNTIKAKMHNQVLLNLHKKYPEVKNIFVDQFVKQETYYKYLISQKEVVKDISFKTKGESYYPSVALASVVARYSFLQEMDILEERYGIKIPLGASGHVTSFAKRFAAKYGRDELDKVCKKHFANYKEI